MKGHEMGKVSPKIVNKPWGHEEIFAVTKNYAAKILVVHGGESLSLQYHERKEETLRLLAGELLFESGPSLDALSIETLTPGDVVHIPPKLIHRMTAISNSTLFEVSTPELDDVVRLEDRYGREGTAKP